MLSDETKKNLLKLLLGVITALSNKELQERIWINGEGPDFTETMCTFFDDANVDYILENYKEFGLTDEQYRILKTFRDEFEAFSDDYYEAFEFIDTPEWDKITKKATEVLKAFNYEK